MILIEKGLGRGRVKGFPKGQEVRSGKTHWKGGFDPIGPLLQNKNHQRFSTCSQSGKKKKH